MIDRRLIPLALGAFVVASDGTLVVGLLRQIADSLAVSPAAAGQAVTVFAAVYALCAPLVIRATRRASLRRLLVAALGLFAVANAATAASPSLAALLGARVLAAACAGVFMATAAVVAARTVTRDRRGRALAAIVAGASAATALGVPLGTFLGGAVGWRATFYGIALLTAIVTGATAAMLPPSEETWQAPPGSTRVGAGILVTLATTLIWATGSFTFFTYIGVVLHRVASAGATGLAGFLLLFGLTGIGGAALAGWLTDTKGPLPTLAGALALIAVSLAGLGLADALLSGRAAVVASATAIAAYGIGTWAITPPQQHRLLATEADDRLLLSLNASALYTGVAVGSGLGGLTLATTNSTAALCWTAAGIELAALTLTALVYAHRKKRR